MSSRWLRDALNIILYVYDILQYYNIILINNYFHLFHAEDGL